MLVHQGFLLYSVGPSSAEVPNLWYMYPWRYIYLFEGVHLLYRRNIKLTVLL